MKKTVFLTGATGNMGAAGLAELLKKKDLYNIVLLARPSKANKEKLAYLKDEESVKIVWGDLLNYDDILKCVTGADIVLHVGGMVSPQADYFPKRTIKTNTEAAKNIVKAVLAQPNKDEIKVVYIGTVAQTSDRNEPIHWGRTGDPICISVYDHYAISKTEAEKIFVESGIKHWVSLRQSGILYGAILKNFDPIMFHVPLRGMLEWATVEDSGRLLANVCADDVPEEFWCNFYNIGSGKEYRLTNYEFECYLLDTISCPRPEKIFEPYWFVTRNFHGQWYLDSDKLEEYLHFRANVPVAEYFKNYLGKQVPWYYHLAKICPPIFIKWAMYFMANKKFWGTQYWIKNNVQERIAAYYGSKEKWAAIPRKWKDMDLSRPTDEAVHIDHGYDESKPRAEWTIEDMREAAAFRGGKCLSETMVKGDFRTPLRWQCADGHEFTMSPVLVLQGGHWCPDCTPMPWRYNHIAKVNPFFSQVWAPLHDANETEEYTEEIYNGFPE